MGTGGTGHSMVAASFKKSKRARRQERASERASESDSETAIESETHRPTDRYQTTAADRQITKQTDWHAKRLEIDIAIYTRRKPRVALIH